MGGSSSTYVLDWVELKAFRFINASHLTSQLPLSLSLRSIILVVARRSLVIMCLVQKTGGAALGSLLLHMNFALKLATLSLTESLFFFPYTGNLWNSVPSSVFPPLRICLPLNVGTVKPALYVPLLYGISKIRNHLYCQFLV